MFFVLKLKQHNRSDTWCTFKGIPYGARREKKSTAEIGFWDFPGGVVVKNLPANAGDTGSIPGPGRAHMPQSN